MLSTFLFSRGHNIADGNRVVFDLMYSNSVDGNDAIKLLNPGVNFGLIRNGRLLAVEARQPITSNDTMFYSMSNLTQQVYELQIVPDNIADNSVTCELIDKFLNTRTTLSLSDTNQLSLAITADLASKAANRLMLVFSKPSNAQPFSFTSLSVAKENNRRSMLNWTVVNADAVVTYEVQKSPDGINFGTVNTLTNAVGTPGRNEFQYVDNQPLQGRNIYRVIATDNLGMTKWSNTADVSFTTDQLMSIYPNPAVNAQFTLSLTSLAAGKYRVVVSDNFGRPVYTMPLSSPGYSLRKQVQLPTTVSKGNYTVQVWNQSDLICTQKLMVQ